MSGLSIHLVRSASEVTDGVEGMASSCEAPFYYRKKFLEAYQRHPVQPVHDSFFLEVTDGSGELVAFAPCYLQGDTLGALGPATDEPSLLSHCWHCYDTRLLAARPTGHLVRLADGGHAGGGDGGTGCGATDSSTWRAVRPRPPPCEDAGLTPVALDTRYVLDLSGIHR